MASDREQLATATRSPEPSGVGAPSPPTRPPPRQPKPTLARQAQLRLTSIAPAVASVATGILLWELVGRVFFSERTVFFSPPSAIFAEAVELWQAGELQRHLAVSGYELAAGLGLAIVVGVAVGFLMAANGAVHRALDPWVNAFYATPRIAIAPLLIIWLGIGPVSIIAVVFLSAVFPMLINTLTGLKVVDRKLLDVGKTYGARRFQMFWTIQFPSALPFILTGVRLAYGRGLVGVVVGELMGATAGIGWLVYTSGQILNTTRLLVGVVSLMFAGVIGNWLLKRAERRFTGWAHSNVTE